MVSVQAPDGEQLSAGSSRQKPHSMGSWLMGTQTGLMAAASRWGLPAQPAHHPDLLLTGRRGGLGCLLRGPSAPLGTAAVHLLRVPQLGRPCLCPFLLLTAGRTGPPFPH